MCERICHDCIHYDYDYTDDDYWETCKITGEWITDADKCEHYKEFWEDTKNEY